MVCRLRWRCVKVLALPICLRPRFVSKLSGSTVPFMMSSRPASGRCYGKDVNPSWKSRWSRGCLGACARIEAIGNSRKTCDYYFEDELHNSFKELKLVAKMRHS